jgi:type I restriction enzyme S subunit
LSAKLLVQYEIALPPLPEQRKIAEILSCWDRAIEKSEELIEKKQRQQNGLMQKLLTGETRLKQYKTSPLWQSTSLDNMAQILFSTVDKKTVPGQKTVKLCN